MTTKSNELLSVLRSGHAGVHAVRRQIYNNSCIFLNILANTQRLAVAKLWCIKLRAVFLEHPMYCRKTVSANHSDSVANVAVTDVASRQHLRSATRQLLVVPRYRLSTYGQRASLWLVRRFGIPCRRACGIQSLTGTTSDDR